MSMDADSVWTVTGDSNLYSFTMEDGAVVQAAEGQNITIYVDCGMSNADEAYDISVGTQIDAFEPGVEYTGVVILVDGAASDEASSEASAEAAADGDTSEAAYQAYLKSYVDACPAVTDEQYEEFAALIDAGNYTDFPVEMCFTDAYWGFVAATYDEFVAAGGNVELPAFDPTLSADA